MTTAHNIDLPTVLAERLTTAHPDVLRELLATFIHALMGAEADALTKTASVTAELDRLVTTINPGLRAAYGIGPDTAA